MNWLIVHQILKVRFTKYYLRRFFEFNASLNFKKQSDWLEVISGAPTQM